MLRAPIWSMSACSATFSTWRVSITSVTMGSPVSARTSASMRSAVSPSPWKAYGEVRGLKAPPRSIPAPAARTACAVSRSISRPSTEQGPATTASRRPPMAAPAPSPTRTTVGSAANSRAASLKGFMMGVTLSTPGSERSAASCKRDSSPMQPTTVRSSPRETWVRIPSCSMRSRMWSSSASVTPGRVTMITGGLLGGWTGDGSP